MSIGSSAVALADRRLGAAAWSGPGPGGIAAFGFLVFRISEGNDARYARGLDSHASERL
jgi:hypothetical protein